jgi:hypothetical protein
MISVCRGPDVVATSAIPTWLSIFPLLERIEFRNSPMGVTTKPIRHYFVVSHKSVLGYGL